MKKSDLICIRELLIVVREGLQNDVEGGINEKLDLAIRQLDGLLSSKDGRYNAKEIIQIIDNFLKHIPAIEILIEMIKELSS